jgi:membrane protein
MRLLPVLRRIRRTLVPFWQAYVLWLRADCIDLSAAFAYHTLQSFFPALLIVLALASRLLGNDGELLARLMDLVALVAPVNGVLVLDTTLQRFTSQGSGAGALGAVLLILSASNIYLTLQRGADRIWWNRPDGFQGLHWVQVVRRYLLLRLKSLGLLLLVGLVIGLDQLISHLRFFGSSQLRNWFLESLPQFLQGFGTVSSGADVALSLLLGFGSSLLFLWLLPSRRIPWRPLIPAALLFSIAITLLNLLLGRTLLALGLRFQAYGVVGGVLVLTLWIWLVGVLLYYVQCLSIVWAGQARGGRSTPRPF